MNPKTVFWIVSLMIASLVPTRRVVAAWRAVLRTDHDVGDWPVGSRFVVVHEPDRPSWLLFFR